MDVIAATSQRETPRARPRGGPFLRRVVELG